MISITGGKDLTLFEVDEAATRIREEVDQDANIIVGATFDETLDGIIRVSVVATGIEQAQIARNAGRRPGGRDHGDRHRCRHDLARQPSGRTDRPAARRQCAAGRARPEARAGACAAGGCCRASPAAAPAQRPSNNVERAALAAIAAAVETPAAAPIQPASYGDVTVRPIAQKPTLFPDHSEAARVEPEQPATPETFIPQAAERAPLRAPRMPKFEELPMPAQAEIRQARGDAEEEHPQKSKLSLLQRLANVGLGRRDEETEPPIAARASGPAMAAAARAQAAAHRRPANGESGPGIGVRKAPGAAGSGRPWPPGTCCPGATGRRPS